jgi:hypothetical protein
MGLSAEVLALGPFSREVADLLDYPPSYYATTRPGSRVVTTLFGIVEGSSASREFAEALGISNPWDFDQHCLDPSTVDFGRIRKVLSGFSENTEYLRDADRMEALAKHGFEFIFLPNG